jgi:hypothetical protein
MREVAESFKDVPLDEQKQSKLAFPEIHSLVVALVDEKERETLLVLLSTRCPRRIGFTDIEFYLTLREKEIPDAILLLGEAYDKAEEAKVRRTIADSFRRGFTASGIRGESDSEFVTNAIKWFKDNKESLSLNLGYSRNAIVGEPEYDRNPLFVKKKTGDEDQRKGNK